MPTERSSTDKVPTYPGSSFRLWYFFLDLFQNLTDVFLLMVGDIDSEMTVVSSSISRSSSSVYLEIFQFSLSKIYRGQFAYVYS